MGNGNHFIAMLAWLLVVQPWTATPDFLAPLLAPISEAVCKGVECGKGNCKPSGNLTLYVCECNRGWKQAGLSFLPCVIPDCSIDFSCASASAPAQDKQKGPDKLSLEPCHWMDCGGGTCKQTSVLTYKCECKVNYYNLLNTSAFPCLQECSLGTDCKSLGIPISNQSSFSPPRVADNTNQASSIRCGDISWLIMLTTIYAPFLLK